MKQIKMRVLLLLLSILGMAGTASATYRLQRVTSVEADGRYVFEQGGRVMINSVSSSAIQTTATFATYGIDGSENYVWTLSSTTGGFYVKSGSNYLNNPSSSNLALSSSKTIWTFDSQSDGTVIIRSKNTSDSFIGYKSASSYEYKYYTSAGESGYQPHSIVVYKLVEEVKSSAAMCFDNIFVKFVKGTAYTAPTLSTAAGFDGTVSYSSTNTSVATVDAATGAVTIVGTGRALITASSTGTESFDAGEATYTLLVMGGDGTTASPYCISDVLSGYMTINSNVYVQGYIVGYYTSSFVFQSTADSNNDHVALADKIDGATQEDITLIELTGDLKTNFGLLGHPERIGMCVRAYGRIGTKNRKTSLVSVSSVTATDYPVTITSYQYATYRTLAALDFSGTGISAYTAAVDGSNVVLTEIDDGVVPANRGVILFSETAATYSVPVATASATVDDTGLSISDGTTATKENNVYVLGQKDGVVGFYRWIGAASLSVGRVYLATSQAARDFLTFVFNEDASAVETVKRDETLPRHGWTDLSGRRLAGRPTLKGLYIVNGRKVVVK